jgi:hypothetical protein
LSDFNFEEPTKAETPAVTEKVNPQFILKSTNRENIFLYDDTSKANVQLYKGLATTNPDTVFVYGTTVAHLQNKEKANLITGQSELFLQAKDMSVGLPTAADLIQDNLATIPQSAYQKIKNNWESKIASLKRLTKDMVIQE